MDYSRYKRTEVMFSGAERKFEILINGYKYIVKFQKNSEIGLLFNHVSEFLGSHIFQSVGIPTQETFLGMCDGKNVVVMKNFLHDGDVFIPFNGVGESSLERDKEIYQYTYDDITSMLQKNTKLTDVDETLNRFWDMFIVDALIGNFDRHGGNWGFIKNDNMYRIAPVYDNGSSLFPRLNFDEEIVKVLSSQEEMDRRIYSFPTSQIKIDNKKSSYYEIISSLCFQSCNDALRRVVPRVELHRVFDIVDNIEGISDVRRDFYKKILQLRYEKILIGAYKRLK